MDHVLGDVVGGLGPDPVDRQQLAAQRRGIAALQRGDTAGGGTLTLEISAFVSTPTTVEGVIRAIETTAGGETCVYRGPIWMTVNTR